MKLAYLIVAAVNPVFARDLIQTNQAKPFELCSVPPMASIQQQGRTTSDDIGFDWKWSPSTNAPVPTFKAGKVLVEENLSLPSQPNLKPGVYKTSPYTLLELVPGPQPDDCSVLKSGTNAKEEIPILQPGLKFIPYSFAGK